MELERAASVINAGERVAILVGAGALDASTEVRQLAERLDAGVAKALLGKTVLPDDLPYVTGPIGLLGSKPSWRLMNGCDTLLMIGTTFPYSEFLPPDGQARAVQIDIAPRNMWSSTPQADVGPMPGISCIMRNPAMPSRGFSTKRNKARMSLT